MVHLVAGHTDKVAAWTVSHIPHVSDFGPCEAIAVMNGEYIIAGVVYHDYQPTCASIQLSMAAESPMWARREIIAQLLDYPFNQLSVNRVWTATPIENTMALRVNRKIGFTQEAVLAHGFGKGRHSVIMRMLKPDYDRLYGREPR
jgi:RimJ/RimL family protein N-acetyltransferase